MDEASPTLAGKTTVFVVFANLEKAWMYYKIKFSKLNIILKVVREILRNSFYCSA